MNLGGLKSWAPAGPCHPAPTQPPSFKDCLSVCGGVGDVSVLLTAKAAVELVFWSPWRKALVALIMNSIIEYTAFVPFCRKVTFCNHVMYIKLFIKVNISHNKRFLNTCE